jgi:hypothetical protein
LKIRSVNFGQIDDGKERGKSAMNKLTKDKFPTSFGVFSPTGHIVMAFPTDGDARKAQQALLSGGFSDADVTHYDSQEVKAEFEKSEAQAANPVQIGQDVANVEEFVALAKQRMRFSRCLCTKG